MFFRRQQILQPRVLSCEEGKFWQANIFGTNLICYFKISDKFTNSLHSPNRRNIASFEQFCRDCERSLTNLPYSIFLDCVQKRRHKCRFFRLHYSVQIQKTRNSNSNRNPKKYSFHEEFWQEKKTSKIRYLLMFIFCLFAIRTRVNN